MMKQISPGYSIILILLISSAITSELLDESAINEIKTTLEYGNQDKLATLINSVNTIAQVKCKCDHKTSKCQCEVPLKRSPPADYVHEVDMFTANMLVSSALNKSRTPLITLRSQDRVIRVQYVNPRLGVVWSDEPLLHLGEYPELDTKVKTQFTLQQPWMCVAAGDGPPCNETRPIHYETIGSLNKSMPSCDVLSVFTHGFFSSPSTNEPIIDGLERYNAKHYKSHCILVVDWSKAAWGLYAHRAVNVITVGRQLGLLLYYMIIMGKVKAQDIHLIGHSLGAHASHYASIWLEELAKTYPDPSDPQINITVSDWKIGRITGLDPAAQGFEGFPGTYLVKEDAAFVDVIHTSSVTFSGNWMDTILGHYGMSLLIGSIDFFPNGGWTTQPDCQGLEYIDRTCSHRMVTDYFRDSLVNGTQAHDPDTKRYPSVPCESWSEFEKCLKTFGVDSQLFEDAQNISSFLTQDQSNLTSSMGIQSVNFYGRGRHYLHAFLDPAKPHKRWSEV